MIERSRSPESRRGLQPCAALSLISTSSQISTKIGRTFSDNLVLADHSAVSQLIHHYIDGLLRYKVDDEIEFLQFGFVLFSIDNLDVRSATYEVEYWIENDFDSPLWSVHRPSRRNWGS